MEKRINEMAKMRGFLSNKMNDWKNINPKDPSCIRISILKAIKEILFWNDHELWTGFDFPIKVSQLWSAEYHIIFHHTTLDGSTNHREMEQLMLKTGFQCNSPSFSGLDWGLGGRRPYCSLTETGRSPFLCSSAGHIMKTGRHTWPTWQNYNGNTWNNVD